MTLIIKRRFHRSQNDSLRIIMALVVHYDLELHQIGVKIVIDDVGAYI